MRHINGRNKNVCKVCGAEFCTSRKLLKHAHIHTTHECVHCKKTFSKKQSLTMHLAKREEKLCTECGKRLCNMSDLNSHCFNHRDHESCAWFSYLRSEIISCSLFEIQSVLFDLFFLFFNGGITIGGSMPKIGLNKVHASFCYVFSGVFTYLV